MIREAYDRVGAFTLEYRVGDAWRPFHQGKRIGKRLEIRFEPVMARVVRLNIREATGGPTLWEFQLFEAGK